MFWDWLTGGGVTRAFGRALSQDIFFGQQQINLRRTLTDRGHFGVWFLFVSAAFRFKCLRWPFIFRGSFSTPSPGIRSARISPTLSALPKSRTDAQQCRGRAMVSCTPGVLGTKGSGPSEGEGSSISLPRGAAVPRGRSRSAQGEGEGEATNLPGNASSDLHLLGNERSRGKRGDESSSCGGGERCGGAARRSQPPPSRSLQRLFHTSPFPSLLSREIQSRQEATCVHVFISRSVRL